MKATKQRTIKASIGDSSKLAPKVRSALKAIDARVGKTTYRLVFQKGAQRNSSKTAVLGLLNDRDVSDELRKPSVIIVTSIKARSKTGANSNAPRTRSKATRKNPKAFGK